MLCSSLFLIMLWWHTGGGRRWGTLLWARFWRGRCTHVLATLLLSIMCWMRIMCHATKRLAGQTFRKSCCRPRPTRTMGRWTCLHGMLGTTMSTMIFHTLRGRGCQSWGELLQSFTIRCHRLHRGVELSGGLYSMMWIRYGIELSVKVKRNTDIELIG